MTSDPFQNGKEAEGKFHYSKGGAVPGRVAFVSLWQKKKKVPLTSYVISDSLMEVWSHKGIAESIEGIL